MSLDHYNFHKDCAHFPECTEEIVKKGKKEMIRFKCPAADGETNGQLYYKGDLHTIKWTCTAFEPYQLSFKEGK